MPLMMRVHHLLVDQGFFVVVHLPLVFGAANTNQVLPPIPPPPRPPVYVVPVN